MKRFIPELLHLGLFSLFALMVLFFRFYLSDNFYFSFLLWNIFLAWIPYLVTFNLEATKYKLILIVKLGLWILFLPNAPYLITDMLHLHPRSEAPYWLDTFTLFVFALNGILLFYASSRAVWNYFQTIHKRLPLVLMPLCFGLCGYGIYIGRWLRFNSWDAVHHPLKVSKFLIHHTFNPVNTLLILEVTVLFSAMLFLMFRAIRSLN